MNWIYLIVGGMFEAGFTFCMGMMKRESSEGIPSLLEVFRVASEEGVAKSVSGWTWFLWLLGFIACTTMSMALLVKASQTLPIGTCYPVWTGVGAVGSVLIGIIFFHEPCTFWRLFFIFTLIASIVGLKMVG